MGESVLFAEFWDGMTSVEGYGAVRFLDALFYKTPHLGTWDAALQYEMNSFYSTLSRRFSHWSYASSRVFLSPFSWIDGGTGTAFEAARPPEYVAAQLAAFRKWGMGRETANYCYNGLKGFDYTPYVPALQAAAQPGVVDAEPPRLEITTPVRGPSRATTGNTLDLAGFAADNLAIRAVRWTDGRGGGGAARMTWQVKSGDYRRGWDWQMDWSISGIALEPGTNRITVTAEDIKGLTASETLTVEGIVALTSPGHPRGPDLPKVLFFANPMGSDNDVIRRPRPEVLSVAERHFAELSRGMFDVTITQDGAAVTRATLARHRAVVFFTAINPPGVDVDGLSAWVQDGGAFIGIHSTANTYQGHPAFGAMLGARYDRRPWRTRENPQTKVRVKVQDRTHPSTRHLGESFEIADDIYQFKDFDRSQVRLLLSLDPASLDLTNPKVNRQDRDFPVSWAKAHGKGRVFYTAHGDWEETWTDPRYRTHLIEAIRWAMRLEGGK